MNWYFASVSIYFISQHGNYFHSSAPIKSEIERKAEPGGDFYGGGYKHLMQLLVWTAATLLSDVSVSSHNS